MYTVHGDIVTTLFFITYKCRNEFYSLVGPFTSYEENEVLRIRHLDPEGQLFQLPRDPFRLLLQVVFELGLAVFNNLGVLLKHRPGANVIKLFTAVIYEPSYYARVFVRLCWKILPGTNTLAYYENV